MTREALIACLPWIAAIVVSVGVLRLLVALSGARLQLVELLRLHRDEKGAVQSLSFVLTLPLFVMILLFIVQLSQLTIARLVTEYAAFAAARSAVVWIPATQGDDMRAENRIGMLQWAGTTEDENGLFYTRYQIEPGSEKFEKIRIAAAMALMPICPSRDTGLRGDSADDATVTLVKAYQAVDPSSVSNIRIPDRIHNKAAWALANTDVSIEIRHRDDEPPLQWYDIGPHNDEFTFNEIGWQDQLVVTVSHEFALLPGPGRFLARNAARQDPNNDVIEADGVSQRVGRRGNSFTYPMTATARLGNEGEKSVLPYIQELRLTNRDFDEVDPTDPPPIDDPQQPPQQTQ